jgi:hypothetical protein
MSVRSTYVTTFVRQTPGTRLGELMNDVRSWLDSNKIESAGFKPISDSPRIGFEIGFGTQHEADRFQREFV